MRFGATLISLLLIVFAPSATCSLAVAGDGCCGSAVGGPAAAAMPFLAAPLPHPQPLMIVPAPHYPGPVWLPAPAFPSVVLVPPGHHVRYPYYSYRAPWGVPGPPQINRTIAW